MIKQQCDQNNCQQQNQEKSINNTNTTQTQEKMQVKTSKISSETIDSAAECIENLSKMQLLDDNSSFFSHNTFQKIVPDQDSSSYSTDSSSVTPHSNILNDNLPDISSSEDWEAAFGFSKKSDSPIEQNDIPTSNRNSIVSETVLNNFQPPQNNYNQTESNFVKIEQQFNHLDFQKQQNFTEKTSRDILEALNRTNLSQNQQDIHLNSSAPFLPINLSQTKIQDNLNGLDQQMSKFFAEFNKSKELSYNGFSHQGTNGFVNDRQNFTLSDTEHNLLLLNQYQQRLLERQLEEQSMFNLKQSLMMNQQQQSQRQHQFLSHQGHSQQFNINGSSDHYITQNNGQAYQQNHAGFQQTSVFQVRIF